MPQSLSSIHVHAAFSTLNRQPFLTDQELRRELHGYMAEISKKLGCDAVAVGGIEDHVHLLVRFGKTVSVAEWIKEVKRVSSVFVKQRDPNFLWQAGYGAFGVEVQNVDRVATYVRRQEEHHRSISFKDEFRSLLKEHELEWDERFLWD